MARRVLVIWLVPKRLGGKEPSMTRQLLVVAAFATLAGCGAPLTAVKQKVETTPVIVVSANDAPTIGYGLLNTQPVALPDGYKSFGQLVADTLQKDWPNVKVSLVKSGTPTPPGTGLVVDYQLEAMCTPPAFKTKTASCQYRHVANLKDGKTSENIKQVVWGSHSVSGETGPDPEFPVVLQAMPPDAQLATVKTELENQLRAWIKETREAK
jgi:hypothetical protein